MKMYGRFDERKLRHGAGDDFLRMAEAVRAAVSIQLMPRSTARVMAAHRIGVILRSPAEHPVAAADRPGAEANDRDVEIGIAKWSRLHESRPSLNRYLVFIHQHLCESSSSPSLSSS